MVEQCDICDGHHLTNDYDLETVAAHYGKKVEQHDKTFSLRYVATKEGNDTLFEVLEPASRKLIGFMIESIDEDDVSEFRWFPEQPLTDSFDVREAVQTMKHAAAKARAEA